MKINFANDRRGSISIIFALTSLIVFGISGLAVDFGRALTARNQLQQAADAAAMAGVLANKETEAKRIEIATAAFTSNLLGSDAQGSSSTGSTSGGQQALGGATAPPVVPQVTMTSTGVAVSATAYVKPFMLQLAGITQIKIEAASASSAASKKLEMALVLDVTGSMCPSSGTPCTTGGKMGEMKVAAKDLMDIVMPTGGAASNSRVSVIPFSEHVNAGTHAAAITNKAATYYGNKLETCVTERTGSTYRYSDNNAASNMWIGNNNPGGTTRYTSDGKCKSSNGSEIKAFIPLTNNRTSIDNLIDSLQGGGGTAGHLGHAWAMYTLSPKWNSRWPTESAAVEFNHPETLKAAVIMTDGEYNTDYTSNISSNSMAAQLCTQMKAADKNIEIFTIGFGIGNNDTARTMLQDCATSSAHYFFPYDGTELRSVFRSIGQMLSAATNKPRIAN